MKGQITVEYMVLSLVVLALLAIAITTLIQVQKSSMQALDRVMFRKSALDLHGTVEEVCALGPGNQRTVLLSRGMSVSAEGTAPDRELLFRNESIGNMSVFLVCPTAFGSRIDDPLYGHVLVANSEDGISITNQ